MKKRLFSLLLVAALLLCTPIVPVQATAAESQAVTVTDPSATVCGCGCGLKFSEVEWKKWTGEVASGHFYLAEDFTAPEQINVISGEKVVLDLRGKTITTAGNSRLFDVQGYVAVLDTVGGGRMMAKSSNGSGYTGGIVIIKDNETPDATFELYSGTITPAPGAKTPKTGGLIYAEAGGSFIMHGGLLLNGKSTASGGCIGSTGNGTEVKILGGQIIGGYAESSGGNVYAGDHVALTVENCTIIGGHADNMGGNIMLSNSDGIIKSCNIGNGVSLSNPSSGTVYGGGNICAYASATMTLESCHVYGGYALRNGGNVCLGNGTMTLKNNTITGGSCGDRGANLASITPTSHTTITGGTIDGDVYYANGNLTLKGAVKIGLGATGLRLNKTKNKFDVSGLTAGAEIYLDTDYTGMTGVKSQYVKPAFRTVLTGTDGKLKGGKATDGETAGYCPHCGEKVAWQPYGTEGASHTYLTADVADAAEVTVSNDLVIDLNSFDITATGRAFHIAAGGKLTVVDSIGTGVITGKGVAGENGGVFYNAGTLKLYGGKYVYASGKAVTGGGVVYNAGTLALYGAVMDASKFKNTASTAYGGAIYSANGTYAVTVNGLRVESGSAYHGGGAFFGFDNSVTIRNANFLKGKAVAGGGNVSFMGTSSNANGTMSLTGVSILDGKSAGSDTETGYSGNIYMGRYKTCTITDSYIAGGTAQNGGNFAANNGTNITCTNCIIEGGTATDKGGLISIPGNSGKLTLDRCLLTNGTAAGNGGGIHVNNGYLTVKGGEISYCTASGSYGGNLYAASDDGTGVVLNADAEGNAPLICRGTAADAGGNMFVSDIVTIHAAKFANGTAPNGGNDLHVGSTSTTLTLGSGIEGDVYMLAAKGLLTSEVYGGAIKNITCEATNANFYLDGKYGNCGITVKDKTMYVSVAAVMDKAGNAQWFSSNADAVEACDEKHYVKLFTNNDLVLTKNLYADLNGNRVPVYGNYTFYGMDSSGDDFTEPTGAAILYCLDPATSILAPNGNTYVGLASLGDMTYHRLDMKITGVSIRPSADGMYYSAKWACDDTLKAQIASFGVVASTKNMPGSDFASDNENLWTAFAPSQLENGKVYNGAVISGIMKNDRSEKENNEYGKTPVFAKAYITLIDGTTCVSSDNIKYSLHDVMKGLDRLILEKPIQYRSMNLPARNFFEKWKDNGMGSWNLNKIPAPADDGVINVLMVGSSFCYYYVQELYALGQAAGIDIRVCNLYYSGCPLEKHYNWWVGGNSNYQYYETYHDGRKLTSNVSLEWGLAQQEWDFISLQESSSRSFENHPNHATNTKGMWEPLLDYFIAQFPDAQVLWHQPWTYQAAAYVKEGTSYTPELQQSNQDKIEAFCKEICDHYNTGDETLVQRVNTGRAWQIMRTEFGYDYLCCRLGKTSADGVDHAGDGYHDGDIGGGQLLNACVWFEIITGKSVIGNSYIPEYATTATLDAALFDNLNVVKTDKGYALSSDFVAQIQQAAHKAVQELGLNVQ